MSHALAAIYKEHGIQGLWRGSSAAIPRVSVGSASQLSTFSAAKELVVDLQVRTRDCFLPCVNILYRLHVCLYISRNYTEGILPIPFLKT